MSHYHSEHNSDATPLIRLSDISIRYDGGDILSNVSFTLRKGDFLAISGPNGGGKTTLLRIMLRLLKPTSGKVTYYADGNSDRNSGRHLRIGYLPQKSMIDTKFPITVRDTVMSGLVTGIFGRLPANAPESFSRAVALCGIEAILDRAVGTLSGGQLQRTLLARAIISDPEVLILDEPLSYVDKQFEHQIYSIMEDLARHTTIVLVSHEMSVISGMATRHLIVDHGITECHAHHHYSPGECD